MSRIGLYISALLITVANLAFAQTRNPTVARFHVVDEQNNPVAGAQIDLDDRAGAVQRSVQTNADGRQSVVLPNAGTYDYEIRKIGFEAQVGNFPIAAGRSLEVSITMVRTAVQLDTVRTESQTRAGDYRIDAAEIARSDRNDPDAYDILFHLKPKMLGEPMRYCPYAQNLWVNGRRVILPPWERVVPLQPESQTTHSGDRERYAVHAPIPHPMSHSPPNSPLTHIRPQDISEMRFVDCWTPSTIPGRYGNNALFVTLKSGIAFDVKKGSYVADSASARSAGVIPY